MKEIENMEIVDMEESGQLSTLDNTADMKLSPNEQFVKGVLENYVVSYYETDPITGETKLIQKKADPETLIKEVIEDSNKIISQNAKGDIIPDYAARAKMKMELLKAAGVVKGKQPEIKLNFFNILFGKNNI